MQNRSAAPSGIVYMVGRLDRLLQRRLGEAIGPLGLTVQQYTILAVLGARGRASNAQLAERSFVTPQSANGMVRSMAERGWVERSPDPRHGRIIHLHLTPAGRETLREAHAAAAACESNMLAGMASRDRDRLHDRLKGCLQSLAMDSLGTR